jgi:predicted aldo/keto reductase-like oxidoreductase
MQYRKFGKLDWQASVLGFGAMRLPVVGEDRSAIDEAEATRLLRHAIDRGVNYIDTAYPYHGGASEPFVGRALRDGYRRHVRVATKLPCWKVETAADFDRLLDEQLERLQIGPIDFYLLHGLDAESWHKMRDLGVLAWAESAMADGRIRHLGFSFHDSYDVFREIVGAYDGWTMCQIQYNYFDEDYQAGVRGLRYAAGEGLAVVAMEPLRGGLLAGDVPAAVQEIWDSAPIRRTGADWALQWLWNQYELTVALSGMSTMQQVEENLNSASRAAAGSLAAEELALVADARDAYKQLCQIPCTDCQYCQPCPHGVAISRIFEIYNEAFMFAAKDRSRYAYNQWVREEERANCCLQCGECESKCPQGIQIIDWLEKAHDFLAN